MSLLHLGHNICLAIRPYQGKMFIQSYDQAWCNIRIWWAISHIGFSDEALTINSPNLKMLDVSVGPVICAF